MIAVIVAVCGALLGGGVLLVITGLRRRPVKEFVPQRQHTGLLARWSALSQRTKTLLVGGVVAGLVVAVWTGFVIAVVVIPVALVGIPVLLVSSRDKHEIERLEAMQEWIRSLSGLLAGGLSQRAAIIATVRSTSPLIKPAVAQLASRLHAGGMDLRLALMLFADDLNDPVGDLISTNLIAGVDTPSGLANVMEALADTVSREVDARRELDAAREGPRSAARLVMFIMLGALGLLALSGGYLAPYATPVGQLVLTFLLAVFVALLILIRRMASTPPSPRFLTQQQGKTS